MGFEAFLERPTVDPEEIPLAEWHAVVDSDPGVTDDDGNVHTEADYAGPPPKRRWWHFWRDDDADTRT